MDIDRLGPWRVRSGSRLRLGRVARYSELLPRIDYFWFFEPLNVPLAGAGVVHDPVISRPVELIVPLKEASTAPLLAHRHVTALSITSPTTVNASSVPPITQLPVSVLPSCFIVTATRGALSPSVVVSRSDHMPDTSAARTDSARNSAMRETRNDFVRVPLRLPPSEFRVPNRMPSPESRARIESRIPNLESRIESRVPNPESRLCATLTPHLLSFNYVRRGVQLTRLLREHPPGLMLSP